jgi:hypothetical protein
LGKIQETKNFGLFFTIWLYTPAEQRPRKPKDLIIDLAVLKNYDETGVAIPKKKFQF